MANISLSVLASDVNDLNGGALTANFSHLLRDPVQITLNRPLVSNWLRAWDFQRYRRQHRTPGPVKISMNYPLVGLRLTSTDRAIYRRYLIDRKSHGVSTSFRLYCHLRTMLLVSPVRALTRISSEIANQTPISATMLLNCVSDAACCNRLLDHYVESGCTCSVRFHSRQNRTDYRITKRFEMLANREIHGRRWKKSCFTGCVSIFPVSLLDASSNFEHDVRLICVLTVYGREVRWIVNPVTSNFCHFIGERFTVLFIFELDITQHGRITSF